MRRTAWCAAACAVLALAAGCKKDGGGSGDKDWSKAALKPYEGEIDGIKFALQVPEGMKLGEEDDIRKEWVIEQGDEFKAPHVRVSKVYTAPTTPAEAVADVMPDDTDVIVKQEAIDGGFLVVWHTRKKGLVRAATWQLGGENKSLDCYASLANDDGIPSFEGTMAWLEQICRSLKLQ